MTLCVPNHHQLTPLVEIWQKESHYKKKGFNGGYLAEVNITLGIDLINSFF